MTDPNRDFSPITDYLFPLPIPAMPDDILDPTEAGSDDTPVAVLPEPEPETPAEDTPPPAPVYPRMIDADTAEDICPACNTNVIVRRRIQGALMTTWAPIVCEQCDRSNQQRIAINNARAIARERERVIAATIDPLYLNLANLLLTGKLQPNARFPLAAWRGRLETWYPADPEESTLPGHFIGRGLILAGDTGAYKTTIACALLARTHRTMGWSIDFLNATQFSDAVTDRQAWKDDPALRNRARGKLDAATRAQLLVIDDLGKHQATATVHKQLLHLIEQRTAHCRPTIVTTQLTSAELATSLAIGDPDTARALVRRLQDYSDTVIF